MFEKAVLETTGQGTDYLPLWDQGYKVLQVYENAQLVYDVNQDPPNLEITPTELHKIKLLFIKILQWEILNIIVLKNDQ